MTPQLLFLAFLVSAFISPAWSAESPVPSSSLGHFGKWEAFSFTENDQTVCYMVTTKEFPRIPSFKRGASHLMITHRPNENLLDVVSYSSGYIFNPLQEVKIQVDSSPFILFANKETAWARTAHMDHIITTAIRQGHFITIRGVPLQKGVAPISDRLDISGASAAYSAISKACGVDIVVPPKPAPKPHKGSKNKP